MALGDTYTGNNGTTPTSQEVQTISAPHTQNRGNGWIGGAITAISDLFMGDRNASRQWKKEKEAAQIQLQNQKDLNKFNQELQYSMWEKTNYPEQVRQLQKAGLSPALLYGQSGGGGTTTGSTGGNASAPQTAPRQTAPIAMAMQTGMQMELLKAQKENIEADTKNKEAQTINTGAQTKTTEDSRTTLIENMRQTGIAQWLKNELEQYKRNNPTDNNEVNIFRNAVYNTSTGFGENSNQVKQLSADLLKTIAEKDEKLANIDLTNQKAKGYWQELLNATAHANADQIKANAIKLATEWGTGEYTNWKTWAELGKEAIKLTIDTVK